MGKKSATQDPAQIRGEWIAAVAELVERVEQWAREAGWETAREDKEITESLIGAYTAPVAKVRTADGGIVYVEPIARHVVGAEGRVDVYAWPSLHRLLLVRQESRWVLKTDSGVDWPEAWGRQAFLDAARKLTEAP